jgi:hypothetical protein
VLWCPSRPVRGIIDVFVLSADCFGVFARACKVSSSMTGYILRYFGPSPVSLMMDLAAPETWSLCEGVLKAVPKLDEIDFMHGISDGHHSTIDLERLSSRLHLSGFRGSRLVLKNAWLGCNDLMLFERLNKSWNWLTPLDVSFSSP